MAKLSALGLRWVGELTDVYFTIKDGPDKSNVDAGTVSHYPLQLQAHIREYAETTPLTQSSP